MCSLLGGAKSGLGKLLEPSKHLGNTLLFGVASGHAKWFSWSNISSYFDQVGVDFTPGLGNS